MAITKELIDDITWPDEQMSLAERRTAFAEVLRAHRERDGISIVALAQATRISVSFLEALEAGQIDRLPGQVFGRGFLRSICSTMRISPEPFLQAFDLCWEGESLTTPPKVKPRNTEPAVKAQPKLERKIRMPAMRWEFFAGTAIVIAAIVASIYVEQRDDEKAADKKLSAQVSVEKAVTKPAKVAPTVEAVPQPKEEVVVASAAPVEEENAPELPPSTQSVAPEPAPAQTAVAEESAEENFADEPALVQPQLTAQSAKFEQVLELKVTEPVRIKIGTDGEGMEVKELKPDTYRFRFEDTADILIYDAAALDVSFNGRSLGSLGGKGRVRRLSFAAKPDGTDTY